MDLIVGDIHGCWEEFQELLERVGPTREDRILAVGDLIDRGPGAVAVFEFFRTTPNAAAVQGNHERKHVAAHEGRVRPALSQVIARRLLGDRYPAFLEFARGLPLWAKPAGALVVHGFFEPGVPLERQRDTILVGTMSGENYLTRKYAQPWYELYEGPPIVVGHRHYRGDGTPLIWQDRVYGIDTNCYGGKALTGLILPDFRLVSVPARANHWAELQARHGAEAEAE